MLLTDTDGLYTADPRIDPDAQLVDEVTDFEALESSTIGTHVAARVGRHALEGRRGRDGDRGRDPDGDLQRARAARRWPRVLAGEPEGTRFPARGRGYSSFKLWLKYAKPSHGTVVVDAGAARALREGGTSLLPVGIVEVHGRVRRGRRGRGAARRRTVGQGHLQLRGRRAARACGGSSRREVREVLPRATEEAVHRDYFVLA